MPEHVLIIGGGAVGLTQAISLLESGHRVTLIERATTGAEASWAGGGILSPLCPWDYQPQVNRLTRRSMAMFGPAMAKLRDETGIDPEYVRSGMLLLPPCDATLAQSWCEKHDTELLRVPLSQYLPGMAADGLLMPQVAQVRNPRLLAALRKRMQMLGGSLHEQCEAHRLETSGDRVTAVSTSKGLLRADSYVVTAGAWSTSLLGHHALNLKVVPIRGQILLLKFDAPPFSTILLQQDLYLIPRSDGHLLIGSTLEDAGFDKSTTEAARVSLLQRVHALFPEWKNRQLVRHWAGLRPGSPDNIPTLGRHPDLCNLYANCGHFRYGVTMSLACAELLTDLIDGKTPAVAVDEYRWR